HFTGSTIRPSVQVVVPHKLATRLRQRTGQRRVDGECTREIVNGDLVLHGHRDRQDQLTRVRRHHHTANNNPGLRTAEHLEEAAPQPFHLRAWVGRQWQRDSPRRHLAGVDRLLTDPHRGYL